MIDITYLTQYAQCRLIFDALTRAGNRQAQVVQDADYRDKDTEYTKYHDILEAANQAQIACDRASLAIANAIVASNRPHSDISNILVDIGMYSYGHLSRAIVTELQAITEEAR